MKIELIKPIISEFPVKYEQDKEHPMCIRVTKSEKYQSGFDYGEEKDVIGKINKIIEWINSRENQPEAHEHNYVPKQYIGTWSASIPPPTMICTKCGSWI